MSQQVRQRWKKSLPDVEEISFHDADNEVNVNVNNDANQFDSLVILEFSLKVPPPAIQWILDKIALVKSKGGSELLCCPIVDANHEVCSTLLLLQMLTYFIMPLPQCHH